MSATTSTAESMAEARMSGAVPGLAETPPDLAAAYALQDAYAAAVARRAGGIAGYKLAVNGKAQMAHFGVREPVCARLFGAEIHASGAELPRSRLPGLAVEVELAAILGEGVRRAAPFDRAAALAAIDRFHAAFELIDMGGRNLAATPLAEAVALNVFNVGAVLGAQSVPPGALDTGAIGVTLEIDGRQVAEARGAAPQDPVDAVAWLLGHLAGRGIAAEPGMVVLCGTHVPLTPVPPAARQLRCTMTGLGEVRLSLLP